MNISELIAAVNYITNDVLLPLTSIQTAEDVAAAKTKGYAPDFTEKEWKKKCPNLPADKIYYLPGLNVGMVYYDIEHIIYLNLGILGGKILYAPQGEDKYENSILSAISRQKEHFKNKEYGHLFIAMPDGLRMDAMKQLLKIEGPSPVFYKTFMEQYTVANFTAATLAPEVLNALPISKDEQQKAATRKKLDEAFPNSEVITVYRGGADKSTPASSALSWSPDINVAVFFASRLGKNGIILSGEVKKEDVIEYFTGHDDEGAEHELIIRPGTVELKDSIRLFDMDDTVIQNMTREVRDLYWDMADTLQTLYPGSRSDCHDSMHSLRVLFLSLLIGELSGCTLAELRKIAEAAIYHDCGRTDDGENETHGAASSRVYRNRGGKDKMVAFAITTHCIDDDKARDMMIRKFPESAHKTVWRIVSVLKDADALDRVRFGIHDVNGSYDGLDVRFLREEQSIKLVSVAQAALRHLTFPK